MKTLVATCGSPEETTEHLIKDLEHWRKVWRLQGFAAVSTDCGFLLDRLRVGYGDSFYRTNDWMRMVRAMLIGSPTPVLFKYSWCHLIGMRPPGVIELYRDEL